MGVSNVEITISQVVAILLGGTTMAELLMSIGKLLTMFVTLPTIALLLLTLIGVVVSKDGNNG